MTTSILQRTTAWLCLAVAILTGLAPAQGFVLCLEPDGCVSIEISTSAETCDGCGDHQDGMASTSAAVRAADAVDCPCVDLPVPGSTQDRRLQGKTIELRLHSWVASPVWLFSQEPLSVPPAIGAPPLVVPRPAESLALIRSVVLLV